MVEMHSPSRSRNAVPTGSAVSSSSHLAVTDESSTNLRTWFAKGRPECERLVCIRFPRCGVLYFIEGGGVGWAVLTHESITMRMPTIFANAGGGKTLNGWATLVLRRKELQVLCVADLHRQGRRLLEEREGGKRIRFDVWSRRGWGRTPWVQLHGYA